MQLPTPPPGWDKNEISKFFDDARHNEFATFANLKDEVARLSDINLAYQKAIDGIIQSKEWFTSLFVSRAHSNFLAACRLCWSAQVPESYVLLRSCLENALYGLYLTRNPNSRETWLRRQDDVVARRKVRDEFKIGTLLDLAAEVNATEGAVVRDLYERTIDLGAHPNELAFMQALEMSENPDHTAFKIIYLYNNDPVVLKLALKTSAQVGACTLSLFGTIYPERFDILGLTALLRHVKVNL